MAKDKAKDPAKPPAGSTPPEQPFEVSPEVLQRAESCFVGADEAARRNNYDYAIALYLEGLRYSPDDVARGHKPLYEAAVRMKAAGKTKGWAAKTARMKANILQMAGKKKDAFFQMERAMAGAPENHLELAQLAQMANSLDLAKTAVFFADQTMETAKRGGKLTESLCVQMANIYDTRGLFKEAMITLQEAERRDKSESGRHSKRIRDMAARKTIGDGLEDADTFHERIRDSDYAKESARQRVITAEDELAMRADEMAKDLEQHPDDVGMVVAVGDMYARAMHDEDALKYYRRARAATGGADYRVKVKMDDLKIRKFRQDLRAVEEQLRATPDDTAARQKHEELLDRRNQFELEVFAERAAEYPTDMSVRYELGLRQYRSDQADPAITSFQMSTRDPKHKILSLNMLGKCFFQKKLHQEAAAQFQAAISAHEIEGDAMWKELRYNLGLTFEAMRRTEQATECYSQIVMSDYNYRDAAQRLQELRSSLEAPGAAGEATT